MKGVAFSDMKSFYFGNIGQSGKGQEMSNGESFLQVFDKTQGNIASKDDNMKNSKVKDSDSVQNHANIQKKKVSGNIKGNKEEVSKETMEEAANKMKEKVAEVLDVSVEEVESVLETLGLSTMDLLNGEVLTQVVMALNPQVDALQIMTNEELYADLKSLLSYAQDLKNQMCEQFQLTDAELRVIMDQMKEMQQMEAGLAKVETVAEDGSSTKGEFVEQLEGGEALAEQQDSVVPIEVKSDKQEANGNNENESGQSLFKEFYQQLTEAVQQTEAGSASYGVSGQEIIRQITEYIKVHVKPETTEMELQLHPASLGSVKVQLASTGGVLSAVFTTENEAVKSVLETQLVQLKENFEQQGLKVESVEVNVSAQGFERSLDQQESKQNAFDDAKEKKNSRRIRLNGLEDGDEAALEGLEEEDKVVVDMMIRNGNSVDYTV